MLSACRQSVIVNFKRMIHQGSCVSGIIKDPHIEDFQVKNEPVLDYLSGSNERKELEKALKEVASKTEDVPIIIGGQEYRTKDVRYQVMPHDHQKKIAQFYYATPDLVKKAIEVATETQKKWDAVPLAEKIKIWMKAADMMATKYRWKLNATTMLGQAKTIVQAEIDSAAELIDFIRLNAFFAKELTKYQPISENPKVTKNSMRYRGLEGFVAAVSPFNFTAIGGNLAYTPTLMGSTTLWKPSDTALLSNWVIYQVMTEAGVPPGVVNFVPADGPVFGDTITASPHLAGINFTGSVPTFNRLWTQVGKNMNSYKNFPRLIGECGGKNFHLVHSSADVTSVVNGTIRSAFEFCGQKCSACSRMYVPQSLWPKIKSGLLETRDKLKVADVMEFDSFMSAVIDAKAFERISGYIDYAKKSSNLEIIGGGQYDNSKGYFIQPTIIEAKDPKDKSNQAVAVDTQAVIYLVNSSNQPSQTLKMVLESTMICVDNSDYMRNGDFLPTRLQAQQDAVNIVCHSKTRSNPENNVGLLTLARVEVLATLTSDVGRILSKLHQVQPEGNINLLTGIRIAHLALKHRQGKNHKMRIVAFVGSPVEQEEKELVKLAKRLKKEKVNVDIVSFGEEIINTEVLTSFINTLNGKDGGGSHLVTVPPGPHLSEALISSPVIQGEDGMGGAGLGGAGFEFGVDPNEDPELALALRVSMEEQRQRQEQDAKKANTDSKEAARPDTIKEGDNEEASLERALAMSVEGPNQPSPNRQTPDFSHMTEEEQIAFAMQMSLQDSQEPSAAKGSDKKKVEPAETPMEVEDYAEVMNDPEFLQSVLENLPGVDPQSEAVRQAVGSLNKDKEAKEKEKKSKDGSK